MTEKLEDKVSIVPLKKLITENGIESVVTDILMIDISCFGDDLAFDEEDATELLENPTMIGYMLFYDDELPTGYIAGCVDPDIKVPKGTFYFNTFALVPELRKMGYFGKLYDLFEKNVIDAGYDTILMHMATNSEYLDIFMNKKSYEIVKVEKDYYDFDDDNMLDAYEMKKNLIGLVQENKELDLIKKRLDDEQQDET
jgi:hypothetical protein